MSENDTDAILSVLQNGIIEIEGLLPWSSNYTFLVRVCEEDVELEAVYKPQRGERPLWDFPQGTLCRRELAAFVISEALGWHLVPPTVLRESEHGLGSVQLFIDHDPERHYFTFEGDPTFRSQLQRMTLLDILINNADRKGGHVLVEENSVGPGGVERLWGIDHGICFHSDPKLRTVIWEFAGMPIPETLRADLRKLSALLAEAEDPLVAELAKLITPMEMDALSARLDRLISAERFPAPGAGRHYPWPPV